MLVECEDERERERKDFGVMPGCVAESGTGLGREMHAGAHECSPWLGHDTHEYIYAHACTCFKFWRLAIWTVALWRRCSVGPTLFIICFLPGAVLSTTCVFCKLSYPVKYVLQMKNQTQRG